MDASKAFDRVNHWTLFRKLLNRGIPIILVRLIAFWYRSQSVCVKWGSVVSPSFNVLNGVRQGGILSPKFFNIYMDELSCKLSDCRIGCLFDDRIINHISYADDLIIFCPSNKGLQSLVSKCELYGVENDIKYNQFKTVGMIIKPRKFNLVLAPDIFLNGHKLNFVDKYNYLGVLVLSSFSDDEDLARQMRCLYIRGNLLARNFSTCSNEAKIKLFKSFCCNLYSCHLWSSFKKSSFHKVRVAYNNCFRILFKLPRSCSASQMFVVSDVLSFGELLRKCVYNFICRVDASQNYLVKVVAKCTTSSQLRKHWRSILYTS